MSRKSVLKSIAHSVIRAVSKADKWAAGAPGRPIFAKLREDPVKLAIAQALAAGRQWAIVDLEWRYRDVPGSKGALANRRTDVVAIGERGQRRYLVVETKAGGPYRTDAGAPREYARQVLRDLHKLRNASAGKVERVFVGLVHRPFDPKESPVPIPRVRYKRLVTELGRVWNWQKIAPTVLRVRPSWSYVEGWLANTLDELSTEPMARESTTVNGVRYTVLVAAI